MYARTKPTSRKPERDQKRSSGRGGSGAPYLRWRGRRVGGGRCGRPRFPTRARSVPEVDEALVGVGVGLAAGMGRRPPTAIFVAMGGGGGGSPARQRRPVDASFAAAALAKTRIFKTSFPCAGNGKGKNRRTERKKGRAYLNLETERARLIQICKVARLPGSGKFAGL
jgi:hypothetical protein